MDSIDMFVSLLDDDGVNHMLKAFNYSTRSSNTSYKKTILKRIFRNQSSKTNINSKPKGNPNPFKFALEQLIMEVYADFTEKEFFALMNERQTDDMPDHIKFANALWYFPKRVEGSLAVIEENVKKHNRLFYGLQRWDTPKELQDYLLKYSIFQGDDWLSDIVDCIDKYLDDRDMEKIDEIKAIAKKWSLEDYYEATNRQGSDHDSFLYQYVYLSLNKDVDQTLRHAFIESILSSLFSREYERRVDLKEKFDYIKDDYISLNNGELERINEEKAALEAKVNDLEREIKTHYRDNQKMKKKMERDKSKYENEIVNMKNVHSREIEAIAKKMEKLGVDARAWEQEYRKEKDRYKKEIAALNGEIKQKQLNFKSAFPRLERENYEFVVIHCFELILAQEIYPEVLFIHVNDWPKKRAKLEKGINIICIQRDGVTSTYISDIQLCARELGAVDCIFRSRNEKELIEAIAYIKKMEGKHYAHYTNEDAVKTM